MSAPDLPPPSTGWRLAERVAFLSETYGGLDQVAAVLEVPAVDLGRWRNGASTPDPDEVLELLDLDYATAAAMARLGLAPAATAAWMSASNDYLDGASPIEVVRRDGPGAIFAPITAATHGL
jgi:hypothetical protein